MDQCKSTLSVPRQALLRLMQQLHFGTIEGLVIVAGEPCLTPPPKIIQEIKLGSEHSEPKRPAKDDFALKRHMTDLFDQFDHLPDRAAIKIEIRHGLPTRLIVTR
jgi:hypothetical protein